MKLKTTARGNFRVFRERVIESEHDTEREAIQEAIKLKQANPDTPVSYDHDYSVDIELDD